MLKQPKKSHLECALEEINKIFAKLFQDNYENTTQNLKGIAKQIFTQSGEIIPAVFENNKYENIVFDQKNEIQWYFRVLPSMVQIEQEKLNLLNLQQTCNLVLIIYTKFEQNELLEFIIKKFPYLLQFENSNAKVKFTPNSYSFDYQNIFKQERGNINFNVNNEWNLIEIRLKSDISLHRKC